MERTLVSEAKDKTGSAALLKGWVHARRNLGKIVFFDVRDRSGLVQAVCVPKELDAASVEAMKNIRPEWVVEIEGVVQMRQEKDVNPLIPTGKIEVLAKRVAVLNEAKTPPFEIDKDTKGISEELRSEERYLDLRSDRMQRNIRLRDRVISFFRDYMRRSGFVEIETPILMKGTPEGAREYVVPSRVYKGSFFVLPQSPQQFKQLAMVAGFERYFQIARCFRDEDQRGDRQPEFTQLDFEMSFVTQEDVLAYTEAMFIELVEKLFPEKKLAKKPSPRLTYTEAMERHGSDKPDLRQNREDPNELAFVWVVDFPMFEKDEAGHIAATHHPLCSIKDEEREEIIKGKDLTG